MFVPVTRVMENPCEAALDQSVLLVILFTVVLAVLGFVFQFSNKAWEIRSYNRWEVAGHSAALMDPDSTRV